MPSVLRASLLALAVAATPFVARSHDLWLEAQGDGLVLRYGHRGGDALDLDAGKIGAIRCRRPGESTPSDVRAVASAHPKEVRVLARCVAASAYVDGGYWSLTPDGEKNLPRSKVPDAVRSWRSRQWAKWVVPGAPGATVPMGDELEVVPVTDLARVRKGDKATFRVLWQGKPAAGAICGIDHRALGETDGAGECRVMVRAPDIESVSVTLKRPLGTPEAEALTAEASLTFPVAK